MWNRCAEEYKSSNPITKYLLSNFYDKISEIAKVLKKTDRVLEVGCGAGESSLKISKMLAGRYFEVSEVDTRYVSKLKEDNFPIKVTRESVYKMDRDDNEFDCLFMLEVLEHLEQYELALKELFRVSKRHVIISVPNEPLWRILNLCRGKYISALGNTPGHINHFTVSRLKKLISRYGKVEKVYTPIPWIILHATVL